MDSIWQRGIIFLLNDAKLSEEYTFDYAWKAVKRRIDELLDDPDRLRLERLLNEDPEAAADRRDAPAASDSRRACRRRSGSAPC